MIWLKFKVSTSLLIQLYLLSSLCVCDDTCSGDNSESCILERLDSEERLKEAFDADAVSYTIQPEYLISTLSPHQRDVTLCTQGSIDRLDRLLEQATAWHGSLSAALYLKPTDIEGASKAQTFSRINSLHSTIESLGKCRLTISLLYGLSSAQVNAEYDSL